MYSSHRVVYYVFLMALAGSVALTGCSSTQPIAHDSAQEAYEKANQYFEEGDYDRAIEYYRGVFQYGRATEWAAYAQYELGRAHEERGEYLIAATEYNRFTQLYSNHELLPDAEYRRGLMYYNESPHYKLDQTDTERAIANFELFLHRHPNHTHAEDAQENVRELRGKLARKKYDAGALYERRRMYRAATYTYEQVFDQYPETDYADRALVAAMRSYIDYSDRSVPGRQEERLQSAIEIYERLTQVFPDSPVLRDAERQYERAQSRLERFQSDEDALADDAS